jgi:tRNA pseudouridine38-40 synthase
MLGSYCGTGYSGMQMCAHMHWGRIRADQYSQTSAKTIEGELFQALVKAGAISQDNADDAKKVRRL